MSARYITILTSAEGKWQVKRFEHGVKHEIENGKWYQHRPAPFETLADLHGIITSLTPHELVVHADPLPEWVQSYSIRPAIHHSVKTNEPPCMADKAAFTLTIDLDDTPIPHGHGWHDAPAMALAVWSGLQSKHAILNGVGCVWQVSGSAGIPPLTPPPGQMPAPRKDHLAKFHFTVILMQPLLAHDRKAILQTIPEADVRMSAPVQKHFLGGRVCIGFADPLAGQPTSGVIDGLPMPCQATMPPVPKPVAAPIFTDQTTPHGQKLLNDQIAKLKDIAEGERHNKIRDISRMIGGYVAGGEVTVDDARAALYAAVSGYRDPSHHHTTIEEYLPIGMQKPLGPKVELAAMANAQRHTPAGMSQAPVGMPAPTGHAAVMPPPMGMSQAPVGMPAPDSYLLDVIATLTTDTIDQLAEIVSKSTAAEKRRIYDLVEERNGRMAKPLKAAVDERMNAFRIEKGKADAATLKDHVFAGWYRVKADETGKPVAVNGRSGLRMTLDNFVKANSELDPVAIPAADGKIKMVPAAEYWWKNTAETYDVFEYDPTKPESWINQHGQFARNSYRPAHMSPAPVGLDVSPYLHILQANIPNPSDQHVLLSNLAFIAQRPGEKLLWATVLQGTQGSGKGLLIEPATYIAGIHNTALPSPENLTDDKNGWMRSGTLAFVDEIGEHRRADMQGISNRIKTWVTSKNIGVRAMGVDLTNMRSFHNWIFATNFADSMLMDDPRERRYAPIISALQTPEQAIEAFPVGLWANFPHVVEAVGVPLDQADAEGVTWFTYYHAWYENGGNEAVRGYLEAYPVARVGRAPNTSSRAEAVAAAMPDFLRIVTERIEAETPGFQGGFVSAAAIRSALDDEGVYAPSPKLFTAYMERLGYKHRVLIRKTPGEDRRFPENRAKQQTLYFKDNHTAQRYNPQQIAKIYDQSQTDESAPQMLGDNVSPMKAPGEKP